MTRHVAGRSVRAGREIRALPVHRRSEAGIGRVPQERNTFKSPTVEVTSSAVTRPGPWSVAKVFTLFPRLEERRGNVGHQLSGGEQLCK